MTGTWLGRSPSPEPSYNTARWAPARRGWPVTILLAATTLIHVARRRVDTLITLEYEPHGAELEVLNLSEAAR
jgi:hypothetical protein